MKYCKKKILLEMFLQTIDSKTSFVLQLQLFLLQFYRTSVINCEKDDEWYLRSVTLSMIP